MTKRRIESFSTLIMTKSLKMINGDCKGMYALIVNNKIIKIMIVTFLRDLFSGCREAPPDSREAVDVIKNGSKRSDKYNSDVKALKERYRVEFETGVCIRIPLKEILEICPRERKRVDAYTGLVTHLKREYGVTLKITSNKTKN